MDNERIIRRIKGLLSTAEGKANMHESHTAFLLAQKLMVKHAIDPSEITEDEEIKEVFERAGTDFKRIYWYERHLARIVADNFRCKHYLSWTTIEGKKQKQYRIEFMGHDDDVELATAMYKLVISAIEFYTQKHVKQYGVGIRSHTEELKGDYMRGFIDGLESKFEEQINTQEWGLVLSIPKEVEDKYKEIITGTARPYQLPEIKTRESYEKGYQDGNEIDYKKETIKE